MSKSVASNRAISESVPYENPLVPFSRMKQIYTGMVQSRLLEEMLRKRHRKAKHLDARGQEACRASTLIGLDPEDFISDVSTGIGTALLRDASLGDIIAYADAVASAGKQKATAAKLNFPGLLPPAEKPADRFKRASGAALALKRLRLPRILVFFATAEEMKSSAGKKALRFAAQEELPILFVALPEPAAKISSRPAKRAGSLPLSAWSTANGVPGIPVDAADAVALYRVAQESLGRARGGDGPALMECVHLALTEGKKKTINDPIVAMREMLLNRKICDEQWHASISSIFESRLKAL